MLVEFLMLLVVPLGNCSIPMGSSAPEPKKATRSLPEVVTERNLFNSLWFLHHQKASLQRDPFRLSVGFAS